MNPPSRRVGRKLALPALLLVTFAAELLTMPRFPYPGDNWIARGEAIHLIERGELGFAYGTAEGEPGFAYTVADRHQRIRGQYYFENDATRRFYSKYGFGHTLLYLPPVLIDRAVEGRVDPDGPTLLLVLNVYNALFAAGIVYFLFRLAARFVRGWRVPAAFALVVVFGSYVWHYVRAPALEVYQLFFFVAFLSAAVSFDRLARHRAAARRSALHLLLASVSIGFLIQFRPTFLALIPVLVLLALSAGPPARGGSARIVDNLRARKTMLLAYGAAPLLLFLAVWMIVNVVRTGAPLDPGYGQWVGPDGFPIARFTLAALPESAAALLLQAGNANVFLHQPVLVFALFGWPALVKRHRREALFLAATILASAGPLLLVSNWRGEWCYGPRYFVHALIAASLPVVFTWRALPTLRPALRAGAMVGLVAILAASFALQVKVNARHYFAYQYAVFSVRSEAEGNAYLEGPGFRPLAVWQLDRFVSRGDPFAPVDSALPGAEPGRSARRDAARQHLAPLVEPNFYLAAPP